MDHVLESLIDFVEQTDFGSLTAGAVDRVTRHTLDAVGCGAGGFGSRPARIAREVARGARDVLSASLYGESDPVPVGMAAFANITANRYLDFNDFGVSGHPSDMIPALLAMAEAARASGADAVTAIYLAYEIATRVAEAVPADGGWDQGVYCSLGIAAGQAKILRLNRQELANALSLAVVPSLPLRVTRFGELSEWKASATAHAAMTATFAVRLARAGMTGPSQPFGGKDGLLERVWPAFDLDLTPTSPSAIERASLKRHPACFWGQVPVDLVLEVRDAVPLGDVEAIEVATCENAWRTIGGGRGDAAEKWRPPTRETADHSMPYLMAVALVDGRLSEEAFAPDRLRDPKLLDIIDRIRILERRDLTARATRDTSPTELTVQVPGRDPITVAADVPRGHHDNPLSDDEVADKFLSLANSALSDAQAKELAERLWDLPRLSTLDDVARLFRAFTCCDAS
ncbi:hypothetical protein N864_05515 [Intrasporangium chromatireducens Q5-1]|uniref:2-methylcitrate dehydratase n=1 Tax=Intrasporangium chromatireducens Q5-1 TaxID=584657 RepID=W9GR64_9MICO|nr:MmgE/PrpD family protein [Intrasporangium chromatireducens]EWT07328.1 hypothetical protein N864_05515 [Intrasporangium chromatireducens Q5-1]